MSSVTAMREDLTALRTTTAAGFAEMRGELDGVAAGQQSILELLTRIAGEDATTTS